MSRADTAAELHDQITSAVLRAVLELCDNHTGLAETVLYRAHQRLEALSRYQFLDSYKEADSAPEAAAKEAQR